MSTVYLPPSCFTSSFLDSTFLSLFLAASGFSSNPLVTGSAALFTPTSFGGSSFLLKLLSYGYFFATSFGFGSTFFTSATTVATTAFSTTGVITGLESGGGYGCLIVAAGIIFILASLCA